MSKIKGEIIPVIHMLTKEQVIINVATCLSEGINKVFLINHNLKNNELLSTAEMLKKTYPELWIGVNLLGMTTENAIQLDLSYIDAIWADDGLTHLSWAELKEVFALRKFKGLFFGGLAFKYQKQPLDLREACHKTTFIDVPTTSGPGTGKAATRLKVQEIRNLLGSKPLALASGVDIDNIERYAGLVDYFLVSSSITDKNELIDEKRLGDLRDKLWQLYESDNSEKITKFATQMKAGLLVIDPQFDFCHPNGKLSVSGAHSDMGRLADWILQKSDTIDSIAVTLDSHQPNDVSHPKFWMDAEGRSPEPFTQITYDEVISGKWIPKFNPEIVKVYIKLLEKQGEYPHFIWPEHCITGSAGASIYDTLLRAIIEWSYRKKTWYQTFTKGEMPLVEHFGALRSQISMADISKEGHFNNLEWSSISMNWALKLTGKDVIEWISAHDVIYIAGEAKSHCVASTIKQVMEIMPEQISKFVILEDCMSDVTGLAHLGEPIFAKAKEMGAKFEKSVVLEAISE
jgi:nicotinamidase-related amidase